MPASGMGFVFLDWRKGNNVIAGNNGYGSV